MAEVRENKMRLAVVQFIMNKTHLNPLLKQNGTLRMIRESCTQDIYYAAMCKCLKQLRITNMTLLYDAIDAYGVSERYLSRKFLQAALNKYLHGFKLTPTRVESIAKTFELPNHTLKKQEQVFYKCFLRLHDLPFEDSIFKMSPISFILSHGFKPTTFKNTTVYCNYQLGQILTFNNELGYIASKLQRPTIITDNQGLFFNTFIRDEKRFILFTHTFHKNSQLKIWKPANQNWCRLYFPSSNYIHVNFKTKPMFSEEIAIF